MSEQIQDEKAQGLAAMKNQLRQKPMPKTKEVFQIIIEKPAAVARAQAAPAAPVAAAAADAAPRDAPKAAAVTIADRRATTAIDRAAVLEKLRKRQGQRVAVGSTKAEVPAAEAPADEAPAPAAAEAPAAEAPAPAAETITIKRKPRKLKKKLKVVGVEKGAISTIGVGVGVGAKADEPAKVVVGATIPLARLPKRRDQVLVKAPAYYLNNRQIFVNFINNLFSKYRDDIVAEMEQEERGEATGVTATGDFSLLTHQKIVRDYLNVYTPYRGLLLYHGLGSGKTCTSIAIAEGMKSSRRVIVMTPASLRRNYIEELKFCGDSFYKKNQYWEFIAVDVSGRGAKKVKQPELLAELSQLLSLPQDYIIKNKGAWVTDVQKPSNFESLDPASRRALDLQLNEMIRAKYQFINYNGLRMSHLTKLTADGSVNPFDNTVVVIDEVHNFISRIVNKLKRPETLSMRLYDYLMSAANCRVVGLSGTPIINYPNEIGILFNILRGYMRMWRVPVAVKTNEKINEKRLKEIIKKSPVGAIADYVSYKASTKTLLLTQNPFGFVSNYKGAKYMGVSLDSKGDMSDADFLKELERALAAQQLTIIGGGAGVTVDRFKALPDTLDEFREYFVASTTGDLKNKKMFQRRILGLTSYFKSAKERLMPSFDPEKDLQVVSIPMSEEQFAVYEEARVAERKMEKQNKKKAKKRAAGGKNADLYEDSVSTYRIFSRLFCNYIFPKELVRRPMPREGEELAAAIEQGQGDEDAVDAVPAAERLENVDGKHIADELAALEKLADEIQDESYEKRIERALTLLRENSEQWLTPGALTIYSPKFLEILNNITSVDNVGSHLVYSQFRTLEGIGILALVLEANGFAEFKIKRDATGAWDLDIAEEDLDKPKYALYTGKEDPEVKEIIRNIYNSTWEYVPTSIVDKLKPLAANNQMGEVIKVFMITASGAEGINLRNCRFVHIVEPYWHPVRTEQVIGRARRIGSHQDLPPHLRNVKVFIYLMTFSAKQLTSDKSIELRLKDTSKRDKKKPITSDEALYEISMIKQDLNKQILTAVKEAAFDCALHTTRKSKEPLVCFSFGDVSPSKFAFTPALTGEEKDVVAAINTKKITWKATEITVGDTKYALRKGTTEVYDYDSYIQATTTKGINPILVGKLEKLADGRMVLTKV